MRWSTKKCKNMKLHWTRKNVAKNISSSKLEFLISFTFVLTFGWIIHLHFALIQDYIAFLNDKLGMVGQKNKTSYLTKCTLYIQYLVYFYGFLSDLCWWLYNYISRISAEYFIDIQTTYQIHNYICIQAC